MWVLGPDLVVVVQLLICPPLLLQALTEIQRRLSTFKMHQAKLWLLDKGQRLLGSRYLRALPALIEVTHMVDKGCRGSFASDDLAPGFQRRTRNVSCNLPEMVAAARC